MFASYALSIARRSRGVIAGSAPPMRAATVTSLISRVKILPFLASAAAFLCLTLAHLECPAMAEAARLEFGKAYNFIRSPHKAKTNRSMTEPLLVAKSKSSELSLLPALANRHGLIAGATGTGKTVTLQTLAEGFSRIGVPVFMADVKGDLSGMAKPGGGNAKIAERAKSLKLDLRYEACPVVFWDVFGAAGHPVRATISDMGPLLLARLLGLNDTQEGVLNLVFKIADDDGL